MPEQEQVVWINGHPWRTVVGTQCTTDTPAYPRYEVERLGGDPRRVAREATVYSNGNYSADNAR